MSTYHFLCDCGPFAVSEKEYILHNLCFCIRWDLRVKWCIPVRPGREMSTHSFSCMGGLSAVSIKSEPGHITINMCFCIAGDLRVMSAFWCIRCAQHDRKIFHARVGTV
jgi:hypothetical protein